jgi:5-formyltetrahydrofolate cyclo-ligase
MEKKELRKLYIEKRSAIPRGTRIQKSLEIGDILANSDEYKQCGKLFIYSGAKAEVDTAAIINKALDEGKRVAVPKMTDKAHEMVFIEITSLYELTETRYGIAEPVYNEEKVLKSDEDTLIVVPLVAFDEDNYRLGYGGGYYDTYLSGNKYMSAIGIAYEEQKCEKLPVEETDRKLDRVIFA